MKCFCCGEKDSGKIHDDENNQDSVSFDNKEDDISNNGGSSKKFPYRSWFIQHLLAACYNVGNTLTYFTAADDLPKQLKLLPKSVLKDLANPKARIVFYVNCILAASLTLTNQRSIAARLQNFFEAPKINSCICPKCYVAIETLISSLYKAVVSSSQVWALTSRISGVDYWLAFTLAAILFPGNLIAQTSNLMEPYLKSRNSNPESCGAFKKIMSLYLSAAYGINQTALYFSTIDMAWEYLGVSNSSLLSFDTLPKKIGVLANSVFSLQYGIQTCISYLPRTYGLLNRTRHTNTTENNSLLGNNDEEENKSEKYLKSHLAWYQKPSVSGWTATAFKTLACTLGLMVVFAKLGHPELGIILGCVLAAGSFVSIASSYEKNTQFFQNFFCCSANNVNSNVQNESEDDNTCCTSLTFCG